MLFAADGFHYSTIRSACQYFSFERSSVYGIIRSIEAVSRLAQSRDGITNRTAALDVPQERGQAAAWVNVRARPGYVKQ